MLLYVAMIVVPGVSGTRQECITMHHESEGTVVFGKYCPNTALKPTSLPPGQGG